MDAGYQVLIRDIQSPTRQVNCLKFFGKKLDPETAREEHFNPRSIICIDECKRACCSKK